MASIRLPPERDDVLLNACESVGESYGRLLRFTLKHRRFDGTWSGEIRRDCFDSGPAVIVLPYDPYKDEVVLIRQFRIGPWFYGADPWIYEIPAGRIDKPGASAEDIALSEAREEAGLALDRLERIAGFFTSPGIYCEHIDAYCGRIIGGARPGTFGLAEENEDIKAEVISADAAIAMAGAGKIASGPTLVTLFWLEANHARLRKAWR